MYCDSKISTHGTLVVICGHTQNNRKFELPTELIHGQLRSTMAGAAFFFQLLQNCPSAVYVLLHFFAFLCYLLMILLLKMAYKCSAEVQKVGMCLMEKIVG